MNRRDFHKAVVGGIAAAAVPVEVSTMTVVMRGTIVTKHDGRLPFLMYRDSDGIHHFDVDGHRVSSREFWRILTWDC